MVSYLHNIVNKALKTKNFVALSVRQCPISGQYFDHCFLRVSNVILNSKNFYMLNFTVGIE